MSTFIFAEAEDSHPQFTLGAASSGELRARFCLLWYGLKLLAFSSVMNYNKLTLKNAVLLPRVTVFKEVMPKALFFGSSCWRRNERCLQEQHPDVLSVCSLCPLHSFYRQGTPANSKASTNTRSFLIDQHRPSN